MKVRREIVTIQTGAQRKVPSIPAAITSEELEVLALVAVGLENLEIATRLAMPKSTVEKLLHSVFGKLGAQGRTHAVAIALHTGVLSLGDGQQLLKDTTQAKVLRGLNDFPTKVKRPTKRELLVLDFLANGTPTQTILKKLDITRTYLDVIIGGVMDKTFTQDRTHAMVIAMRLGWLSIETEREA